MGEVPETDSVRNFAVEDTPVYMSHAGSNNDLTAIGKTEKVEELPAAPVSDDSEGDDAILEECIQLGMRRQQQAPPQKVNGV